MACARRVCSTDHPGDFESAVLAFAEQADRDEVAASGSWETLLLAATDQGMVMLLTRELERADLTRLAPADVRARYKSIHREGMIRALTMTLTLIRALDRLEASGIRAMPWKGPALGEVAYGDAVARHFVDLDVLVYPAEVPRAIEVLEGAGWRRHIDTDIGPLETFMRTECELGFVEPTRGTSLEIHWALQRPSLHSSQTVDTLWKRADSILLLGRPVPCPGPAETFIGLAAHAAKHGWLSLESACALGALVVTNPDVDWAAVVEQSRSVGCYRRCLLSAAIVHDSLAVPLPDDLLHAVRSDPGVARLAARAYERWNVGTPEPGLRGTAGHITWNAATFDRWDQGTRHALATVFGPQVADRVVFTLPPSAEPLYAALRPARLTWKYARRAVRRGAGGERNGRG
jgi:hypothetical protein